MWSVGCTQPDMGFHYLLAARLGHLSFLAKKYFYPSFLNYVLGLWYRRVFLLETRGLDHDKSGQVVRQIGKYISWLYRHFDIISVYMV